MKQKMKKCLCLMLSFVFVLSNCQLFAQAATAEDVVKIDAAISEDLLEKATKDMAAVKHSYENLYYYVQDLFQRSKVSEIDNFTIEHYRQYANEIEKSYTSLINRIDAYDKYLFRESQKDAMERVAYRYTAKKPRIVVRNTAIAEGTAIQNLMEEVENVIKLYRTQGVYNRYAVEEIEKRVSALLNFLGERLQSAEYVLENRIPSGQNLLSEQIDKLIANGSITRESILKYLDETMPAESHFVEVIRNAKAAGEFNYVTISRELKTYLRAIGSKQGKSTTLRLMRRGMTYKSLEGYLKPEHQRLLRDFPVAAGKGAHLPPSAVVKGVLKVTPIMIVASVLTVNLIAEVRNDNQFTAETVGVREISKLQKRLENGEGSFADAVMFFTNSESDKIVNRNPKYLLSAINLAMTLEEANNDFEDIDAALVEEEKLLAYNEAENEDIQATVDEQLASITDQVLEDVNMI